jgi:hypothetical protein
MVSPIKFVYFRNLFLKGFFFSKSLGFVMLYGVYMAYRSLRMVTDLGVLGAIKVEEETSRWLRFFIQIRILLVKL